MVYIESSTSITEGFISLETFLNLYIIERERERTSECECTVFHLVNESPLNESFSTKENLFPTLVHICWIFLESEDFKS